MARLLFVAGRVRVRGVIEETRCRFEARHETSESASQARLEPLPGRPALSKLDLEVKDLSRGMGAEEARDRARHLGRGEEGLLQHLSGDPMPVGLESVPPSEHGGTREVEARR